MKVFAFYGMNQELLAAIADGGDAGLALSSAAFGPIALSDSSGMWVGAQSLTRPMFLKFHSRLDIVKRMFMQGAVGNRSFVNEGFKRARDKEIDVEPAMLMALAHGELRSFFDISLKHGRTQCGEWEAKKYWAAG